MARFAETIHALEKGAEEMTINAAVKNIEGWEEALADLDSPGAKQIVKDLGTLKSKLQKDGEKADVASLLAKLGAATSKIASEDEKNAEKLEQIGSLLGGEESGKGSGSKGSASKASAKK